MIYSTIEVKHAFLQDLKATVDDGNASVPEQNTTSTEPIYNTNSLLLPEAVEFAKHLSRLDYIVCLWYYRRLIIQ